jgi:hypothetical protein
VGMGVAEARAPPGVPFIGSEAGGGDEVTTGGGGF